LYSAIRDAAVSDGKSDQCSVKAMSG